MDIWFVNSYATPPDNHGGPTRHLGLARELIRRGHRVTIVAGTFDHYARQHHRDLGWRLRRLEDVEGIRYLWIRTPPYRSTRTRILNMVAFGLQVRFRRPPRVVQAPDVIVGSSPHLLSPWASHRLARRTGAASVFEVRDVWPQSLIDLGEMGEGHPAMAALARIERRLYRECEHVLVVPPAATDHVLASGGARERITHLPNGADPGEPPPPVPDRGAAPFTVVYAGTIGLANGLDVVVDAAAELRRRGVDDVRFRLVGNGPLRAGIAARVAELGLENVELPGAVPNHAVRAELTAGDACLMVLRDSPVFRWGVSPTKLFDYFAAARPVVFAVRSPNDPVREAGAGVSIEPDDPVALADAVVALRDLEPGELRSMGERGRAYLVDRHSFSSLAATLDDVLAGVLRGRAVVGA